MSTLDQILGEELRAIHQTSFNSWIEGNMKPSFEKANFQFRRTECMTRDNEMIPVLKYFKAYLSNFSQLEFVCMLKVNKKSSTGTSANLA